MVSYENNFNAFGVSLFKKRLLPRFAHGVFQIPADRTPEGLNIKGYSKVQGFLAEIKKAIVLLSVVTQNL